MVEWGLQMLPVLKDVFMVFRPLTTWNRIAESHRSPGFVFVFYLLPMLLLAGLVEGHGLTLLGRYQVAQGMHNRFLFPNVVAYEVASWSLAVLSICVAAGLITSLANTCHARNNLSQSLVVAFHVLGPLCLIQLFNGFPHMYLWLTWLAGITFAMSALYHGLPRIMHPDPPSAMGLFMGSAAIVFLLMLGVRLVTYFYLAGDFKGLERHLSELVARLL